LSPSDYNERRVSRRELLVGGVGLTASLVVAGSSGASLRRIVGASGPASHVVRRGGRLRIGLEGEGQAETLNPMKVVADADFARAWNLFDNFVRPRLDGTAENALAESFEPNADASVWTIRLRHGVEWHDGKPLTADDAIYTLHYAAQPTSVAAVAMKPFDLQGVKKLDARTLRVPLKTPIATLPDWLLTLGMSVIQAGTKTFDRPIGTGAFKFVSWKKGVNSLFVRNPNYWEHPKPYVDSLVLQSLPDPSTRLNALLSGQVDAIHDLSFSTARQYRGASSPIRVMAAKTPAMIPITMAVDEAPFNDVRVRQAMRLIADRNALVKNVNLSFGSVGNDIYGLGLPFYDNVLPQREQNIPKAKSLLKAAGHDGLTVQINTSTAASGMLESATLFAQDAAKAGVTVRLKQYPADSYFSPPYLKWAFGQDFWLAFSIPVFFALGLTSAAPYNETHWRKASFDKLFFDALGELKPERAKDKWHALQKIQYEQGGFLIWGTTSWVDGLSKRVGGAEPNAYCGLSAMRFADWWLE
jgi:peptide/nickel transport system substrate-binding protein